MKHIAPKLRRGFTLIELLVVMSIIIVLLLLVLSVGRSVREKSLIDDTRARLRVWATAVQTFQDQTQRLVVNYHVPKDYLYDWAFDIREDGAAVNTLPTARRQLSALGTDLNAQRKDSWGRDMYYRCLPTEKADTGRRVRLPQEPFFWSMGPDGKAYKFLAPDGVSWIYDPLDMTKPENLDNIFSFDQ